MKRLSVEEFRMQTPETKEFKERKTVGRIIAEVKKRGDAALREFTLRFDKAAINSLRVEKEKIDQAASKISPELSSAMCEAAENIRRFAQAQLETLRDFEIEVRPGVFAGQVIVPIERIGVYAPGGRYPLFSSLLMGALPARVAGVREIAVCTPPGPDGDIPPAVLAAAGLCGIDEIYRVGGAQAVAAMAYGTESIRKVDKIVGPGNAYVTAAKRRVYGDVGVDLIAGPTELLVIADLSANPSFIAADLIAQAEHDVRAMAILMTDSEELAEKVELKVEEYLGKIKTAEVARESLEARGAVVLVPSISEALELADERAPEHLELFTSDAERQAKRLRNFGSLFIGEGAAEVLGDYTSGLNHILPTRGAARFTGGLGVRDFLKVQTTLRVKEKGLAAIGPAALTLAEAEGLEGHALSIKVRRAAANIL
jgi:histidinol dehydrogenase